MMMFPTLLTKMAARWNGPVDQFTGPSSGAPRPKTHFSLDLPTTSVCFLQMVFNFH